MTPDEREILGKLRFASAEEKENARAALREARAAGGGIEGVRHPAPFEAGPPQPMGNFPAKYAETLERNQKLHTCCRHTEGHTGQMFKTQPDMTAPDVFIATCGACGRKHYRFFVGPPVTFARPAA